MEQILENNRVDKKGKYAIIDLGTNTFNLLIIESTDIGVKKILEDRVVVKVGKGGINNFFITDEASHRALNAIHYFKKLIDLHKIIDINAIATSAFRTTRNGQRLADKIEEETGIKINIISGAEEAQLIYEGVKASTDLSQDTSMIMDIGGGSVEFIICNDKKVFFKKSYEIGAQRLLDLFHRHDPIKEFEIINLENYLSQSLEDLLPEIEKYKPSKLIGSSGTFDTLSQIHVEKNNLLVDIKNLTNFPIPVESFEEIYHNIIIKDKNDRLKINGMHEMRVEMIVVATILLRFVLNTCNINKLVASFYSLKEGAMFQILNKK